MYVVTGVTGNTGRAVAETLLARGAKLRVVVRDAAKGTPWAERGAEVAVAEFTDIAALVRAFAGAEGVYAMTPPEATAPDMLAARDPMNRALAQAARQAGVPHVVLLSSIGAQHAAG
ncbi:MAG TPA: NAD(P)H-binding protein, partial [Alphaproteobacteria bacterium]|nr:NAD(P)H-binding protein [Alphaproteobacteria bacterium]